MEFNEKLQELRKSKGLTQEELSRFLFVSRTAVSKWESGRGYPNIESLKAIAKFFSVSVDELLSGEEVLTIAEEDTKKKEKGFRGLVFGLLDISVALFFFLPFFGQKHADIVDEVSLLFLMDINPYLRVAYLVVVIATVLWGILTLALQGYSNLSWENIKSKISLAFNVIGTLLFIISAQVYAAALLFVFLIIKVLIVTKW